MFSLALSSQIYFLLLETPFVTLWSSCAQKPVMRQRVFRGASEFKVRNFIKSRTGHFAISSLHSTDEPQVERNSCPLLRSCFIGSSHVGVSKRFSRSLLSSILVFKCQSSFKLIQRVLTNIKIQQFNRNPARFWRHKLPVQKTF